MGGDRIDPVWAPYCGAAPSPGDLLARWNLDPLLLAVLAGAALAWHLTIYRRGQAPLASFLGGMAALAVLFVSPLCAMTSALFAARTVHHALLVAVAAPLLAWSLPERSLWRKLPIAVWTGIGAAVLWAWHVPALYATALSHDPIYWLMQASLLASAIAFWSAVRQSTAPAAVAALLANTVQMGLLGAILTFASTALYAPHFLSTAAWGYTPLEDQQLGGLVMWAPAAALYLFAALLIVGRWLGEESRTPA